MLNTASVRTREADVMVFSDDCYRTIERQYLIEISKDITIPDIDHTITSAALVNVFDK